MEAGDRRAGDAGQNCRGILRPDFPVEGRGHEFGPLLRHRDQGPGGTEAHAADTLDFTAMAPGHAIRGPGQPRARHRAVTLAIAIPFGITLHIAPSLARGRRRDGRQGPMQGGHDLGGAGGLTARRHADPRLMGDVGVLVAVFLGLVSQIVQIHRRASTCNTRSARELSLVIAPQFSVFRLGWPLARDGSNGSRLA